ncbi:MAG: DUF481 domain-containing protein [Planctomycetota bacterium]
MPYLPRHRQTDWYLLVRQLLIWGLAVPVFAETEPKLTRLPPIHPPSRAPETDAPKMMPGRASDTPNEAEQQASNEGEQTTPPEETAAQESAAEQTAGGDNEPLLQEPLSWYQWVYPSSWVVPPGWESSFEIGVDGSEGNSSTLSVRTGADLKRSLESSELEIGMTYVKATAESRETKHNAQLDARHDWLLGESPWSLFAKTQLEYDEFKAHDIRLAMNAGVGYQVIANESTQLKGRFGSGTSREFRGPDDRWVPEAVFGMDFEHQFSDRQRIHATIEYLPEWDNFHDYRVHGDCGWEFLVDKSTNMNLKLGLIERYDSTPNGREPNDLDFSLLLRWNL